MRDITNMFRASLKGDPPGLGSQAALIPKQHSEDLWLKRDCCVESQLTGVRHKGRRRKCTVRPDTVHVGALCQEPPCDTPATA